MKHIILTAFFFISAFSFAQDGGYISGSLLDFESNNEPLMFAKVSIKETGAEVLSDEKGTFKFENLKDATYTLVFSFVGYESKQLQANVISGKSSPIQLSLEAKTLYLEDLIQTIASADKKNTSASLN